jgi:hypothetical protein
MKQVILFLFTFVSGYTCKSSNKSSNVTLNTIPSIISTESVNPTVIVPSDIPLPKEGGDIIDNNRYTIPSNSTKLLEYILIVENLLEHLYNLVKNVPEYTPFINGNNTNVIRNIDPIVNRPACTYKFNNSALDYELRTYERVAVSMYKTLNVMEGTVLFNLKMQHRYFLNFLTGTPTTIPLHIRSIIGITGNKTTDCLPSIPFISFFALELNVIQAKPKEVLEISSLVLPDGKHCAFVGNLTTVFSDVVNDTCKVPETVNPGDGYIYLVNDTSSITDMLVSSVISGPALLNIISSPSPAPFDDGTRIISSGRVLSVGFIGLVMMFL